MACGLSVGAEDRPTSDSGMIMEEADAIESMHLKLNACFELWIHALLEGGFVSRFGGSREQGIIAGV